MFDSPVVNRSLASLAGLDSDIEGIMVGTCEEGAREVEGGRERLRITGG